MLVRPTHVIEINIIDSIRTKLLQPDQTVYLVLLVEKVMFHIF